ncbi:EAL domain-containing protein [Desulfurella sp.]|uniref:EAL and HDOD domain-containing protein n=1 Tax=Desulfurella sp. TaxID=1962857 RepID=UPI0025C23A69|nr:EAL domain-containing protein [Desulfurella sp.]
MQDYFIGRQPIVNTNQDIFAYELLYRDSLKNFVTVNDNRFATSQTIINLFERFGIENVIGDYLGFLNLSGDYILSETIELIPKEKFVIEILEGFSSVDKLITKVLQLKDKGYIFSLDDFVYKKSYHDFTPVINYIDYIKIDVRLADRVEIAKRMDILYKISDKLIAEKVETKEDFEFFKHLGFKYFQGYFFERPTILKTKDLEPNQVGVIKLLNLLNSYASIKKVKELFEAMPDITLRLIKFINSAAFGLKQKINSINQAINLIGYNRLKIWLLILTYADKQNIKKSPVFQTAVIRGKQLEILSENFKDIDKDSAFLVGILSLIDVVIQKPKEELFEQINIDDLIKNAVLFKEGKIGTMLLALELDEKNDYLVLIETLSNLGISMETFVESKLKSYAWLQSLLKDI